MVRLQSLTQHSQTRDTKTPFPSWYWEKTLININLSIHKLLLRENRQQPKCVSECSPFESLQIILMWLHLVDLRKLPNQKKKTQQICFDSFLPVKIKKIVAVILTRRSRKSHNKSDVNKSQAWMLYLNFKISLSASPPCFR